MAQYCGIYVHYSKPVHLNPDIGYGHWNGGTGFLSGELKIHY